jgi:hypothetical protein
VTLETSAATFPSQLKNGVLHLRYVISGPNHLGARRLSHSHEVQWRALCDTSGHVA